MGVFNSLQNKDSIIAGSWTYKLRLRQYNFLNFCKDMILDKETTLKNLT